MIVTALTEIYLVNIIIFIYKSILGVHKTFHYSNVHVKRRIRPV